MVLIDFRINNAHNNTGLFCLPVATLCRNPLQPFFSAGQIHFSSSSPPPPSALPRVASLENNNNKKVVSLILCRVLLRNRSAVKEIQLGSPEATCALWAAAAAPWLALLRSASPASSATSEPPAPTLPAPPSPSGLSGGEAGETVG